MSNALKIGQMKDPTQSNGGITSGCIVCWPCHMSTASNTLQDISGNSRTGLAGVALVPGTAFASPQGITTAEAASTDTTCRLSLSDFEYSFNAGDSLLIHTRVKLTAVPAATKPLWAQGGNSSAAQGVRLNVSNTGVMSIVLDHPGGTAFLDVTDAGGPSSNGVIDTNWRSITVALWGHVPAAGTASYGIWIDGVCGFSENDTRSATSMPTSVTPVEAFRVGQYYRASGPVTASIGGLHSYLHAYRAPQAVTNTFQKMQLLAKRLHKCPSLPLNSTEWPMT